MKKFTIIKLKRKNIEDFSKVRNELLKKAKTDWVLFLDTDEKLSSALKKEVLKMIQYEYDGFYVYRKNYFLGKYSGTDKILRLGQKKSGKWVRRVHEKWEIEGRIGQLKNPIIHNTAGSISEMITKINYYSTLHAQAHKSEGKKPTLFKIIFYPKAKFIQSLLMGRGLVFSILQSFHSFLAWGKQWAKEI